MRGPSPPLWLQQSDAPCQVPRPRRRRLAARRRDADRRRARERRRGARRATRPATSDERNRVDGRRAPLGGPEPRVVYAVNKPVGVLSTARDTHGRPTVVELIRRGALRLYPVGRLDADSSGLILLTNDGELANRLTHPRYEVPKTYRARARRRAGRGARAASAARRRELEDGPTAPAQVRRVGSGGDELEADDPRRPQPPGAAHVRGGRPPRARAAARRLRPAAARRPCNPARTDASARPSCASCGDAGRAL